GAMAVSGIIIGLFVYRTALEGPDTTMRACRVPRVYPSDAIQTAPIRVVTHALCDYQLTGMPKQPSREAISDEMRHLSARLADELVKWPEVTARTMFGFRAFYRGALIFALLPEKRTLETP